MTIDTLVISITEMLCNYFENACREHGWKVTGERRSNVCVCWLAKTLADAVSLDQTLCPKGNIESCLRRRGAPSVTCTYSRSICKITDVLNW